MKFLPVLKFTLFSALMSFMIAAHAADESDAGTVKNLTGTLTAKNSGGALRTLAQKDVIHIGDTLYTGHESYAKVLFKDGGEVILRSDTHFLVSTFHFDEQHPEKDAVGFSLLKGSLRALTGLISKRGDKDSYEMKTPVATIGIRGTDYALQICRNDCEGNKTADGKTPRNGLHSQVNTGAILERNKAGGLQIDGGEFAYVANEDSLPEKVSASEALKIDIPSNILDEWDKNGKDSHECPAN